MRRILPQARHAVIALFALGAFGCSSESTAPTPPDQSPKTNVSGVYSAILASSASTCTPASAVAILEHVVVLDAVTVDFKVRVDDLGDQVRFQLLEIQGGRGSWEGSGVSISTVGADGTVRFEPLSQTARIPVGEQTFVVTSSGPLAGKFDRTSQPMKFAVSGTVTSVFREGSPSASVFATCTQTQTATGSRTVD